MFPTMIQLSKKRVRTHKIRRNKVAPFRGAPQRKAVVYKIAIMTPRKPNSARRTFAKVRILISNKKVFAKIPGIGQHFLQPHSVVLVRGHGPKDSPGINYHLIRGLYDFNKVEVYGRRNRRSKFGVKRPRPLEEVQDNK
jgi:small subunit ribosomal protein S12